MKKFIRDNSLTIVLFILFVGFLYGLSLTGLRHENDELSSHGQPEISYRAYVLGPGFGEAVFENFESEFLQMAALVVLTIWLRQKGSADSKQLKGKIDVDTHSRYSIIRAATWHQRGKALGHALYSNSLSLALLGLFLTSFWLHALTGVAVFNEKAIAHGEETLNVGQYLASSTFWFESFQNWQSEFLSVGVLLILSVFLRQRGSPESKPVSAPDSKTGH